MESSAKSKDRVKKKDKEKPKDKFKKIILWIDDSPDIEKGKKKIEEQIPGCEVLTAKTKEEGLTILQKYRLRLIFVITSGRSSQDYMDSFEKDLKNLDIISVNIIFCGHIEYHIKKVFANDKFFNPGGIHSKFNEVIDFIKTQTETYKEEKEPDKHSPLSSGYGCSFKLVRKLSTLARPTLLGKFMTQDMINRNHFNAFVKHIEDYGRQDMKVLADPRLGLENLQIPYYLYSKFFLKLYSLESPFYPDINKDLTHVNENQEIAIRYNPFIYSLYMGLCERYLKSYYQGTIYRAAVIGAEELKALDADFSKVTKLAKRINEKEYSIGDETVNLATCTANSFLSFSKEEKVADRFMVQNAENLLKNPLDYMDESHDPNKDKKRLVKYVLEGLPPEKKGYFVSNIDIDYEKISEFTDEKEVLALPYSCFKVEKLDIHSNKETYDALLAYPGLKKTVNKKGETEYSFLSNPFTNKKIPVTTIYLKHIDEYADRISQHILWARKEDCQNFLKQSDEGEDLVKTVRVSGDNIAEMANKKVIIWIDQFANCQKYDQFIEENKEALKNYKIYKTSSVKQGYRLLNSYQNILVYIIISGKLAKEFFSRYEDKTKKHGYITANIILCEAKDKDLIEEYKKMPFVNDPFMNPGGFVTDFKQALNFITREDNIIKNINISEEPEKTYGFSFVTSKDNLREKYLGKWWKDPLFVRKKLREYENYFYLKYDKMTDFTFISQKKDISLPPYLYSTNFMKMYVCKADQNPFVDMCKDLTHEKYDKYLPYIFTIYSGVKEKLIKNYEGELFRGSCLKKKEIVELKQRAKDKIPIWTKPFLTFTKNKDIAIDCISDYNFRGKEDGEEDGEEKANDFKTKLEEDCAAVLFTVKLPQGAFASNMMTGNFRRFKEWDEIVILPFTGFIVKSIKPITNDYSLRNALELELEYCNLKEPEIDYGIMKLNDGKEDEH